MERAFVRREIDKAENKQCLKAFSNEMAHKDPYF
jgi:hypothetical protein